MNTYVDVPDYNQNVHKEYKNDVNGWEVGSELKDVLIETEIPEGIEGDCVVITKYLGHDDVIEIPETIEGLPVKVIQNNSFLPQNDYKIAGSGKYYLTRGDNYWDTDGKLKKYDQDNPTKLIIPASVVSIRGYGDIKNFAGKVEFKHKPGDKIFFWDGAGLYDVRNLPKGVDVYAYQCFFGVGKRLPIIDETTGQPKEFPVENSYNHYKHEPITLQIPTTWHGITINNFGMFGIDQYLSDEDTVEFEEGVTFTDDQYGIEISNNGYSKCTVKVPKSMGILKGAVLHAKKLVLPENSDDWKWKKYLSRGDFSEINEGKLGLKEKMQFKKAGIPDEVLNR